MPLMEGSKNIVVTKVALLRCRVGHKNQKGSWWCSWRVWASTLLIYRGIWRPHSAKNDNNLVS